MIISACNKTEPDDIYKPDDDKQEEKYFTMVVDDDGDISKRNYKQGEVVTVTGKDASTDGGVFVCWKAQGEPYSYEKRIEYTVNGDAVLKAVYSKTVEFSLDCADCDKLTDSTATINFDDKNKKSNSVNLYEGYSFVLPVPTLARHDFKGWSVKVGEETKNVTDENGVSLRVFHAADFALGEDGKITFFPRFEERGFITVTVTTGATGNVTVTKWYIEDGDCVIKAETVPDKKCIAWYKNDHAASVSSSDTVVILQKDMNAGDEIKFHTEYKEAYKLTVIKGKQSGYFTKEESVSLSVILPPGQEFKSWTIKEGDKVYTLGEYKEKLCLIDGAEFVYYDENKNETVRAEKTEEVRVCKADYSFTFGYLEKLGLTVSGKRTEITANFTQLLYTLTYRINAMVNGKNALGGGAYEENLSEFTDVGNGIYELVAYVRYGEAISRVKVPKIQHYKFVEWQNDAAGENIPDYMPKKNVLLVGTFLAEQYKISVDAEEYGSVRIGATGNIVGGYFDYGSTVKIYATANSGYCADKWVDSRGLAVWETNKESVEGGIALDTSAVGKDIEYVFLYEVGGENNLRLVFDRREYTISYRLTVVYDNEDVTGDKEFFARTDDFYDNETEESIKSLYRFKYKDEGCALRAAYKETALGLKFADKWNFSGWSVVGNLVPTSGAFSMPSSDIVVEGTYTIKAYNVDFSKDKGIRSYEVKTVNGKNAEGYKKGDSFLIPYGSEIVYDVKAEKGYAYEKTTVNKTADIEYRTIRDEVDKYGYEVSFDMLVSASDGIAFTMSATKLFFAIKYYARTDYASLNEAKGIEKYVVFDPTDVKTIGGKEYMLVKYTKETADESVLNPVDGDEYGYDDVISALKFTTEKVENQQYTFETWTKMTYENGVYNSTLMPDEDLWAYGEFKVKSYKVSLTTGTFKFDENPNKRYYTSEAEVLRTDDGKTFETPGEVSEENSENEFHYYTSLKFSTLDPTGYNFRVWKLTSDNKTVTLDTNVTAGVKQNKDGYEYVVSADGDITLYLDKNVKVSAEYDIKRFKVILDTDYVYYNESKEINITGKGSEGEYLYLSNLSIGLLSPEDKLTRYGNKVTDIIISYEKDGIIEESERIPVNLDDEKYEYVSKTWNTEAVKDYNVRISAVEEKIEYKIKYYVYYGLKDINELNDSTPKADIRNASDTVRYNEQITLLQEDEIKDRLNDMGIDTDRYMFSGWYEHVGDKKFDNNSKPGDAMAKALDAEGNYIPPVWKHTGYNKNKTYSCYLIDIFEYADIEGGKAARLSSKITNVYSYNKYFINEYRTVSLPEEAGVTAVGGFAGTKLTSLTLPANILTIEDGAFKNCGKLTRIDYSSSKLKSIGNSAFEGCGSLLSSAISDAPGTLSEIGDYAFKGCGSFAEVNIKSSVSTIGTESFAGLSKLTEVTYDGSTRVDNGFVGNDVFKDSASESGGFSVIIGKNASYVAGGLFGGNVLLKKVTLLDGGKATEIGSGAFQSTAISEITGLSRVTLIADNAFRNCTYLTAIDLRETTVTDVAKNSFEASGLNIIYLPSTVTNIDSRSFYNCKSLVKVYYETTGGESVLTKIGANAFASSGSAFVPLSAFAPTSKEESGEKTIDIPSSVVDIGQAAFANAQGAETVRLSSETITLGSGCFNMIKTLKHIDFNVREGVSSDMVFGNSGQSGLTLKLGERVEKIGTKMFNGAVGLSEAVLPQSLVSIGDGAFSGISALTKIAIKSANLEDLTESGAFATTSEKSVSVEIYGTVNRLPSNLFVNAAVKTVRFLGFTGSEELSLAERSFADVGADVTFPRLNKLVLEEYAFKDAQTKNLVFDADTSRIEIGAKSLATENGFKTSGVKINIMGKQIDAGTAEIKTPGDKLIIEKGESGYVGTVYGGMKFVKTYDLLASDRLVIASNGSLSVEKADLYVHGAIEDNGAPVTSGSQRIIGYGQNESDLLVKTQKTYYTDVIVDRDITLSADYEAQKASGEFGISVGATLNAGNHAVIVSVKNLAINGLLIAEGEVSLSYVGCVNSGGAIRLPNTQERNVTLNEGAEGSVRTRKIIGSGAVKVLGGEIKVTLRGSAGITYEITQGSEAEINGFIGLYDIDKVVFGGTARVSAALDWTVPEGEFREGNKIEVNNRFTVKKVIGAPNAVCDMYKTAANGGRRYYADIIDGKDDDSSDYKGMAIRMLRSVTLSAALAFDAPTELYFNGFSLGGDTLDSIIKVSYAVGGATAFTMYGANVLQNEADAESAIYVGGAASIKFDSQSENKVTSSGKYGILSEASLDISKLNVTCENGTAIYCKKDLQVADSTIIGKLGAIEINGANVILSVKNSSLVAEGAGIIAGLGVIEATVNGGDIGAKETGTLNYGIKAEQNNFTATLKNLTIKAVNGLVLSEAGKNVTIENTRIEATDLGVKMPGGRLEVKKSAISSANGTLDARERIATIVVSGGVSESGSSVIDADSEVINSAGGIGVIMERNYGYAGVSGSVMTIYTEKVGVLAEISHDMKEKGEYGRYYLYNGYKSAFDLRGGAKSLMGFRAEVVKEPTEDNANGVTLYAINEYSQAGDNLQQKTTDLLNLAANNAQSVFFDGGLEKTNGVTLKYNVRSGCELVFYGDIPVNKDYDLTGSGKVVYASVEDFNVPYSQDTAIDAEKVYYGKVTFTLASGITLDINNKISTQAGLLITAAEQTRINLKVNDIPTEIRVIANGKHVAFDATSVTLANNVVMQDGVGGAPECSLVAARLEDEEKIRFENVSGGNFFIEAFGAKDNTEGKVIYDAVKLCHVQEFIAPCETGTPGTIYEYDSAGVKDTGEYPNEFTFNDGNVFNVPENRIYSQKIAPVGHNFILDPDDPDNYHICTRENCRIKQKQDPTGRDKHRRMGYTEINGVRYLGDFCYLGNTYNTCPYHGAAITISDPDMTMKGLTNALCDIIRGLSDETADYAVYEHETYGKMLVMNGTYFAVGTQEDGTLGSDKARVLDHIVKKTVHGVTYYAVKATRFEALYNTIEPISKEAYIIIDDIVEEENGFRSVTVGGATKQVLYGSDVSGNIHLGAIIYGNDSTEISAYNAYLRRFPVTINGVSYTPSLAYSGSEKTMGALIGDCFEYFEARRAFLVELKLTDGNGNELSDGVNRYALVKHECSRYTYVKIDENTHKCGGCGEVTAHEYGYTAMGLGDFYYYETVSNPDGTETQNKVRFTGLDASDTSYLGFLHTYCTKCGQTDTPDNFVTTGDSSKTFAEIKALLDGKKFFYGATTYTIEISVEQFGIEDMTEEEISALSVAECVEKAGGITLWQEGNESTLYYVVQLILYKDGADEAPNFAYALIPVV